MSFLLDALGKADDDRRRAEVPELRTQSRRERSMWGRIGRALLLLILLLGAFAGGYMARPWLDSAWLQGPVAKTTDQAAATDAVTSELSATPKQAVTPAPTTPAPAEPIVPPASALVLEVISWSERPQARFAMINGAVVHEGDTLASGERLLRIEQEAVVIEHAGQTLRLAL